MVKVTGNITKIFDTKVELGRDGKEFKKRIIWIKENSEKFPSDLSLEAWLKDVEMIDNYKEGDLVTCYLDIKGRKFMGRDGEEKITNTLKVWNIEKDGVLYKKI